jgi:predicted phage baseplate assembly protein
MMGLQAPNLDNRRFQDLVDEAKRLIPRFCPEWTDHNVSDPGIALVELFAWMTETLLYRANQVPEKNYIKFLEMLGVRLEPPRSATAPVTFYLSAPPSADITIPQGTEAATVRTETAQAIVFTTEADLTVRPPAVTGLLTQRASLGDQGWVIHDMERLALEQSVILFPNPPSPGDAFYIALQRDHSHHVLAIVAGCERSGGAGIDPSRPPIQWEVWQGDLTRWVPCDLERDTTGGFNVDGEFVVRLPAMVEGAFAGVRAYWLRCRILDQEGNRYEVSPELQRYFRVESRGGTVSARHAIMVKDEVIGQSAGTPGQMFTLLNTPVLSRDPESDFLIVQPPDGPAETWREVPDFADSGADDRCFTLDSIDGTLTFGPALLQPDGSMYHFGAVPRKGSLLRFRRYLYGGGVKGNVPVGAISVLKASIPYVARVRNHQPALGGRDPQTVEDAKVRVARNLRSIRRAVTADDFEFHTSQVRGVARARCLAPGEQPGEAGSISPGQVFMIVLPQVKAPERPDPEELVLSAELRQAVLDYLQARCVLGLTLEVRLPQLTFVSVQAELRVARKSHPAVALEVQRQAEAEIYAFLNPYVGGPLRQGWPFGRDLHLSEIYGLLQRIPQVEYVEAVKLEILEPGSPAPRPAPPRVVLSRHGLICSARHVITVERADEYEVV